MYMLLYTVHMAHMLHVHLAAIATHKICFRITVTCSQS
jgi:hypothetical protein